MEPPAIQYVLSADGTRIAYGVAGSGVPLLYLPITFSNFSLQWSTGLRRDVYEGMAARFRLITYDARGLGASQRRVNPGLTLADLDADLEAVASRIAEPRFVLFGPIAHALTAVRYAVHHPERVAALVLHNHVLRNLGASSQAMRTMADTDWESFLLVTARTGFPSDEPELVKQVLRATVEPADLGVLSRLLRNASVDDLLPRIQAPTLVLASRAGMRMNQDEASGQELAATISNARLQLLDGSDGGVKSLDGEPPQVVAAVAAFINELNLAEALQPRLAPDGLSSREVAVLRLIAAGKSNPQIADELMISRNTVQAHVASILNKARLANRTEAAVYAERHGLI